MLPNDLALGGQLTEQAGWNQVSADWNRFLALQPSGCFIAELDGQSVGTVTTCVFGRVGWIGMLLVNKTCRRRGVGRALLNQALAYLEKQEVETVRLDATPQGEPLYNRLGFSVQYHLTRFAGTVESGFVAPAPCLLHIEHGERVVALDQTVIGYGRGPLLLRLVQEPNSRAFIQQRKEAIRGYACTRPGRLAAQVGPCVATSSSAGRILLAHSLNLYRGQPVFVDIPTEHQCAVETVTAFGLKPARVFTRMCRGAEAVEQLDHLWASSGPEKG